MSDVPQPPTDPAKTLGAVLGFETVESGPDRAVGRFEVQDRVRQPMGIVHGGVYAAMAEGLTSQATFEAVFPDGFIATGMSNQTNFLRPVSEGIVTAYARSIHRGRTTWVWEVEFKDDRDRLSAVCRMTIAIRRLPEVEGLKPEATRCSS
ncbi:MAG TPA: PaaI family thioesterase [Gemmatimonadales bacterium]|nr:PaaI family thioesterase [Gemmatimonadales bacterium]